MVNRVALISDVHGNILALEAVLKKIRDLGIPVESVFSLGDLVGYGPRPNEVLNRIRQEGVFSILGNYDEAVGFYLPTCGCKADSVTDKLRTENSLGWTAKQVTEDNKAYLRNLEEEHEITLNGVSIHLTHGSPFSINEYVYESDIEKHDDICEEVDADILVMGHTHMPYIKQVDGKVLINPGSVGRPKDGDIRAAFCVVDVISEDDITPSIQAQIIRVSYDVESVAREIEETDLLDEFAEHLRTALVD